MGDFVQRLADELTRLAAVIDGAETWIDQRESIMGRNRHCAAVRRRIAEGLEGASIIGRRCLLTPKALREEMQRHMVHPQQIPGPVKVDPLRRVELPKPAQPASEEQAAYDAVMAKVGRLRGA